MRVLILGGTSEALELSRLIAGDRRFTPTLSLAGRTAAPRRPDIATRVGGFGGAIGLAHWLKEQAIDAVVDATHPFADQISTNAVAAARVTGIPLGSIVRPPWARLPGDSWLPVADPAAAARALGEAPRRVFLTVGRLELPQFCAAPQHHYLARTIEPVDGMTLPPQLELLRDRGPFGFDAEREIMSAHKIDVVVSKHSGGAATYGKIAAARELGLPVVMIERPAKPCGHVLADAADAVRWLAGLAGAHDASVSDRGV